MGVYLLQQILPVYFASGGGQQGQDREQEGWRVGVGFEPNPAEGSRAQLSPGCSHADLTAYPGGRTGLGDHLPTALVLTSLSFE